jgi:RNA polymerase sigma factor (sigma-70 family)
MRDAIKSSDARVFVKSYRDLLSADEERALFQNWWDTNPQGFADLLDTNKEVKKFIGGNDDRYLSRIVLEYSPIIRRAMKELSAYRMDEDELLSEGLIALAEAARRYAPSEHENVRFGAYAKICVKGMMQGYIMKHYFMVQFCTNRSKKRLFYAMRKYIAIALRQHGTFQMTEKIVIEMSTQHNVAKSDVWLMFNMFQRPFESLDQPVGFTSDVIRTLGDTIESNNPTTEDIVFSINEVVFHRSLLDEAMAKLTHREKTVFVAQVLSEKESVRTLDDLAGEFDCSKERVRQVRNEAQRKVESEVMRIAMERNLNPDDIFDV